MHVQCMCLRVHVNVSGQMCTVLCHAHVCGLVDVDDVLVTYVPDVHMRLKHVPRHVQTQKKDRTTEVTQPLVY